MEDSGDSVHPSSSFFSTLPPIWSLLLILLGLGGFGFGFVQLRAVGSTNDSITVTDTDVKEEISTQVTSKITVDISGAVQKPGVYTLSEGSRVKDAIALAGGWNSHADAVYIAQQINLAEVIQDQQKIYIPSSSESARQSSIQKNSSKISINSATLGELDTLEGVGESRANNIIENRPYSSIEELVSKKVLSESIFQKIKDQISL